MTAISTTRSNGDTIDVSHVNSLAKALKGIGLTDDNAGAAMLARATRGEDAAPMRLFHWSITYLSLLFLAIAIDPFLFS